MDNQEQESRQQPAPEPGPPGQGNTFDIQQIIDQARQVLTRPADFYAGMPRSGGFGQPVIFILVMAVATGIIAAFWSLFGSGVGMLATGVGAIIIYPIFALIGAFIAAGVLFLIWKLMGSEEDYETAFRCWSAATAIYPIAALLAIIPYIGTLVSIVWGSYLMIEASVAVHGRARQTATIVFGILGALLLFSNISSEYAARQMGDQMEEMSKQFEIEEDMTPEEAGRQMGEFLKGLQEAAGEGNNSEEN